MNIFGDECMTDKAIQQYWREKAEKTTRDYINELPLVRYDGPIHLIQASDQISHVFAKLSDETVLGFDTETRPAFKKGESYAPALIQLATESAVYLFQLSHLGSMGALVRIFSNPSILKVGMAPRDDIRQLQDIQPFQPAGFLDLVSIARQAEIKKNNLRTLAAMFLGLRISKRAQRTNWGRKTLTPAQIVYAATDAWASRNVYLAMVEQGLV